MKVCLIQKNSNTFERVIKSEQIIWMELENIILSEVSQAQKTKNRMFSLICRL
jgi:hypothetical protein